MRDGWLQGMETIVQRQQRAPQRAPTKSDDGRLLGLGQDRRARFLWPGLEILNRLASAPLRNRLGVRRENSPPDCFLTLLAPKLPAQRRERSLRSFGPGPRTDGGPALIIAALTACVVVRFRDELVP